MTTLPIAAAWQTARAEKAARDARRARRRSVLVALVTFFAAHLPRAATVRTFALRLGGLGALTASAWQFSLAAGLAAAGVSLLLLEWAGERR